MHQAFEEEYQQSIDIKVKQAEFHEYLRNELKIALENGNIDAEDLPFWQDHYDKLKDMDFSLMPDRMIEFS